MNAARCIKSGAALWAEVGPAAVFECFRRRDNGSECEVIWTREGVVELEPGGWEEYEARKKKAEEREAKAAAGQALAFVGLLVSVVVGWLGVWLCYEVLKMILHGWERGVGAV